MRGLSWAAVAALAATSAATAAARPITLDEARELAERAPARRAAGARTEAARLGADAAGGWPAITVGAATTLHTAKAVLTAALPVPIFGKPAAARRVAEAELEVARAEEAIKALELRRRATEAWLALAAAGSRAALAAEVQTAEEGLAESARKRFAAGDAPRVDVVMAEAAAARARVDAKVAAEKAAGAAAALAGELGLDPATPLEPTPGLPEPGHAPPLATLEARAAAHPEAGAARGRVALEAAKVAQARRERWPELALEAEADLEDPTLPGSDFRVGVTFDLPILAHGAQAVAAARAGERAATLEREATLRALAAGLATVARKQAAAEERARALETEIVPAQRSATEMARVAYREGEVRLVEVLAAERALAETRGELVDALVEAAEAWAELEVAAGGLP